MNKFTLFVEDIYLSSPTSIKLRGINDLDSIISSSGFTSY